MFCVEFPPKVKNTPLSRKDESATGKKPQKKVRIKWHEKKLPFNLFYSAGIFFIVKMPIFGDSKKNTLNNGQNLIME